MWINRKTREAMLAQTAEAAVAIAQSMARESTYKEQNKVLQVNLDWLRTRVNQLEHERAQLIFNYMGIKIAVPEIQTVKQDDVHPLNAIPHFNDVGDAEAARMGIGWDEEGRVAYSK